MADINRFKQLGAKTMQYHKYRMYLNEPRKNLAAPGKQLLRCSTAYVHVGDIDRSPLMRSYGYASAVDRPILFAIFPLTNSSGTNLNSFAGPKGEGQDARSKFISFMQHAG